MAASHEQRGVEISGTYGARSRSSSHEQLGGEISGTHSSRRRSSSSGSSGLGLAQRRLSASNLPPLFIPGQDDVFDGNRAAGGDHNLHQNHIAAREMFGSFIRQEIERAGLSGDNVEECISPIVGTPALYKNPLAAKYGKDLRILADEFAKTPGRKTIIKKANDIPLSEMSNYEQFADLLSQLFSEGGITRERIVVLFFFCSDLAIRTLKNKAIELFTRFIEWSMRYISDKVCDWVQQSGGWGIVLSNAGQVATRICFGVAAALAIITIVNWLKNK